jgi:hypothetical protein
MPKTKNQKVSYKAKFGRIVISENDESEFKVGFLFKDEPGNPERFWTIRDEARITDVSKEIWYVYREHRYAFEENSGAAHTQLTLADETVRRSYHAEQGKENRFRSFYLLAEDHPSDLEIRVEVRDGKKIMMLKKGNGADVQSPIIRRQELKLTADVRETEESILSHLPREYQDTLGFEFNKKSGIFMPMQTNSQRLKTKVRFLQDSNQGHFVFHIELAHDSGSGLTIDRKRWPIREYEAEVKGIYELDGEIDIKHNPEIFGFDYETIGIMCERALQFEREDFLEFATLYLLEKSREYPERYADICVDSIYFSKSHPGRILLKDVIDQGQIAMKKLCYDQKTGEPKPFQW